MYAAWKGEIGHQPALPHTFGFRLGRDECHGPACSHLSSEDGCEEGHCENTSQPLQACARRAESASVCMHTVVIAFRV